jgi:hypothetical protein
VSPAEIARAHADAIADTGDGYRVLLRQGYVLECLWCPGQNLFLGQTMAEAVELYRAHEAQMLKTHDPAANPVRAAGSRAGAIANVSQFVDDLIADGRREVFVVNSSDERDNLTADGRYGFDLAVDGRRFIVVMPGLPLERVRYVNGPGQDIFAFPQVDISGRSWAWMYALRAVVSELGKAARL